MALTTTSEPSAVDRHAVVDGFVLSVADTITSKGAPEDDRSRLQSPKASRTTMLAASVHFFARRALLKTLKCEPCHMESNVIQRSRAIS
jgi:hypothetical protein